MFIGWFGTHNISPTGNVTTLAYYIFRTEYGTIQFMESNIQLRFAAGLVLVLITVGLTVAALFLKRASAKVFRGGAQ